MSSRSKRRHGAKKKTRERRLSGVETIDGKLTTADLFSMMLAFKAERPGLCEQLIEPPIPELAWTVRLPGYDKARDSAVEAYMRMLCRSELFREWCESSTRPELSSILLRALGYGLGRKGYLLDHLSTIPAADHVERSHQVIAALRSRDERPIRDRWLLGGSLPPCGYHLGSVVTGRLQQSLELYLPLIWTGLGLWLANAQNATALLTFLIELPGAMHGLPIPEPSTYSKWTRSLRLSAYEGSGQIIFGSQHGFQANAKLLQEAEFSGTHGENGQK